MLFIVEVPVAGEPRRLIDEMSQMRTWLDQMHYDPIGFRQAGSVCRVEFANGTHARAFSAAFSGRLRSAFPA